MMIASKRLSALMLEQSRQAERLVPPDRPMEAPPIETQTELSAEKKLSDSFYTKEEEPWKGKFREVSDDRRENKTYYRPMTKEDYLVDLYLQAHLTTERLYSRYDKFMAQFSQSNAELAGKNFTYTLGNDAEIKILDPSGELSPEEIESIKEAMNGFQYMKEFVQDHARTMMKIVDHDTDVFGRKVKLNLLNFQTTVDFGNMRTAGPEAFLKGFIEQIREHGEKSEDRLTDIRA